MAMHAPIDMSENVRNPAICPLRLRSMPTSEPSTRLRAILTIAVVDVSSTLLIASQKLYIGAGLFRKSETTRYQTVTVGEKLDRIVTGIECGVDIPIDCDTGHLITRIFDILAGCGRNVFTLERE